MSHYNSYYVANVSERASDPPDESDYWEESIPRWVATVSDANGTVFYTTPPDDSEDAVITTAALWIAEHRDACQYEEYLEAMATMTDDRPVIHGTDPSDYLDDDR